MKTATARGCGRGVAVGVLLVASLSDLSTADDAGVSVWPTAAVLLVGFGALLWPARRRPRWLTLPLRTAAPALASGLYTGLTLASGGTAGYGLAESLVLLCLLFLAVRHSPPRWAVPCAVLDAGAGLVAPLRHLRDVRGDYLAFLVIALVVIGLTAGLAAYLRSMDYRRAVAVGETRRAERLAIAADLHDFVAHHVTGILVQTQVARMMATDRSGELDPVLAGIEGAATDALASMRRTVGVLRDSPEEADRRPVGDLAGITDLVDRFAGPGQQVELRREPGVGDDVPHEVQAAAFRVVQEALTNVRRHAGDATLVTVGLRRDGDRLEVSVTDDGRGGTRLPDAAHGGGFGLVGLKERVTALGGRLAAGPRQPHGWEVRAMFPARS